MGKFRIFVPIDGFFVVSIETSRSDLGLSEDLQSVSRLDAPTSGALIVPTCRMAAEDLKERFASRKVAWTWREGVVQVKVIFGHFFEFKLFLGNIGNGFWLGFMEIWWDFTLQGKAGFIAGLMRFRMFGCEHVCWKFGKTNARRSCHHRNISWYSYCKY